MIIVFAAGMIAVSKRITKPIEKMYTCLSEFKYDTEQDRKANIQSLMDLNIHTNTEIQSLYNVLIETAKNSFIYQHDLEVASQALDTMEEMVYTDSLTGLGNKYGCDEKIKEIQKRIDAGKNIDFAVIMADINNLKYVNDNFGHDKGDKYIIGCTKILSKYFSPNSIFRLGGDEFIIFVENRDYLIKDSLLKKAIDDFASLENNEAKQPHHRYSMSLGISDFKTDFNLSVVETMQKADAKMYEAKVKHKELYGSYR